MPVSHQHDPPRFNGPSNGLAERHQCRSVGYIGRLLRVAVLRDAEERGLIPSPFVHCGKRCGPSQFRSHALRTAPAMSTAIGNLSAARLLCGVGCGRDHFWGGGGAAPRSPAAALGIWKSAVSCTPMLCTCEPERPPARVGPTHQGRCDRRAQCCGKHDADSFLALVPAARWASRGQYRQCKLKMNAKPRHATSVTRDPLGSYEFHALHILQDFRPPITPNGTICTVSPAETCQSREAIRRANSLVFCKVLGWKVLADFLLRPRRRMAGKWPRRGDEV